MWRTLVALPVCLLAVALLELPYGYYTFLRIVITIAALWLAHQIYDGKLTAVIVLLGLTAILYNPIVKVHMERETHAIFNVLTIFLFAAVGWVYRKRLS